MEVIVNYHLSSEQIFAKPPNPDMHVLCMVSQSLSHWWSQESFIIMREAQREGKNFFQICQGTGCILLAKENGGQGRKPEGPWNF